MKCKKCKDAMYDYLGDRLAGHLLLEFEVHIERCDECATELEETEKILRSMKSLSNERVPIDCWSAVHARISQTARPERAWQKWFLRPVVAGPAFAVLALLLVVLIWPLMGDNQPSSPAVSIPEYSRYISAHSHAQRHQAFTDPDVTFVTAELEKASLTTNADRL